MSELLTYLVENEPSFRRPRLPALYSDFRSQRTLNPDGYAANSSAWRRALAAGVRAGLIPSSSRSSKTTAASTTNLLTFAPDESLLRALESKQFGRPLALGSAVRDGLADKEFIALPDFLSAKKPIVRNTGKGSGGSSGVTASWAELPWTLAAWAWRQVGFGGEAAGDDSLPVGQHPLVVMANVEAAAQAFIERVARPDAEDGQLASRFQRTFSPSMFRQRFADLLPPATTTTTTTGPQPQMQPPPRLSDADLDVLLRFLSRDRGLLAYDGRAVRIHAAGGEASAPAAITDDDAAVAALRELLERLAHQTALLGRRVDELVAAAKDAVARKNRPAALAALRSKKLAEASLGARAAVRAQLEEVADRIEQAADQVAVVRVMEASAQVLKGLNAQVGGAERVEGVVEKLRVQMGQADEVAGILAEAGSVAAGGEVVDEGEIDDELEAMEREERAKKEAEERRAREAEEEKRAEETARRLVEIEEPTTVLPDRTKAAEPAAEHQDDAPEAEPQEVAETAGRMRKMSLEEQPVVAS